MQPRVAKRGFRVKRFADYYPSLRVTSWGRVVTFASDSNDARVSVIGVSEAHSNASTLSALSIRLTELQLSEDHIAATKGGHGLRLLSEILVLEERINTRSNIGI